MDSGFFSEILLPLSLGLLMFGMGLSLSVHDFEKILIFPRALIVGLSCQMLLLPVIAFVIALLSGFPPEIKVGFMIIAACPGGATSNLITYLLRGNVALSISMTMINSFLTLFSVPLILFLALSWFTGTSEIVTLPVWNTVRNIFLITILPVSTGVVLRYFFPILARTLERPGRVILPLLFALIYVMAVASSGETRMADIFNIMLSVAPFAFLLNLLGMLTGYTAARWLRYGKKVQITLSVEVGIQNSALAITIASSVIFLNNPIMAIPAMVYGLFTFITAILFGILIKRKFRFQSR
ncbi:MAG: bile acid:sodium symporter family protein [Bacteroidales bacterium]